MTLLKNPISSPQRFCHGAVVRALCFLSFCLLLICQTSSFGVTLWTDPGPTVAENTGLGVDSLGGAVKRDDSARDTLYFRFRVKPISDSTSEDYFSGFELYEGEKERLGVGNALKAWAYSAYFRADDRNEPGHTSYIDLQSSHPEVSNSPTPEHYELPRRGTERTIVFKIQYVPDGDDLVTVWLDPDLGAGANELHQPEVLTTRFSANASFDEIRLRHGGSGGGWTFADMVIATSFNDFADRTSARPGATPPWAGVASLGFQSWQRDQGLPDVRLTAIAQTREGYLWLGGDSGLVRFDGARFVAIEGKEGWQSTPVTALLGDSNGGLWIGTLSNGVSYLHEGKFRSFARFEGVPDGTINAISEDNEGQLWIGSDHGLAVWREGRFVTLNALSQLDGKPVVAIARDPDGGFWIALQSEGVYRFADGNLERLNAPVQDLLTNTHCLLADHEKRLWIGSGEDLLLCRERDGTWRTYKAPRHSQKRQVISLAEELDGTVWAGSISEGLFHFKNGRLTPINTTSGLSENLVRSILVSREGILWVCTESGLNKLRRQSLYSFALESGLGRGIVAGLAEVDKGIVWAAKPADGLYRWEGKTFSRLNAAGLAPHDMALGPILVSRDGSCWVASSKGLIRYKDPQAVADEGRVMGLENQPIAALAEDIEGRILAGTREGQLWRLDRGQWKVLVAPWHTNAITALWAVNNGDLWVGTDGKGAYRISPGETLHLDASKNGLLSGCIRAIYAKDDVVWIGTSGGGLARFKGGQISVFTTRHGLPDDTISQILEDEDGRLWVGTGQGIACITRKELDQVAKGSANRLYPRIFGLKDGMPSQECSSGFSPGWLRTKDGLLWFPTLNGVAVADPRVDRGASRMPVVILESLNVDGNPQRDFYPHKTIWSTGEPQSLKVKPGRHHFEMHYTALDLQSADRIRFRYKLEGLDADWVDAGTRRTAFYNYVPPGDYTFRVAACNRSGAWSEKPASISISVSPYVWQNWWVIGGVTTALLAAFGGTIRLIEGKRSRLRLERIEHERALERERTRIARDLHDEMGAKLCRISFLSEHARNNTGASADAQRQIASISEASREVLHSLDQIVWAVNPKNDSLEHLVSYVGQYVQDYFSMTGIECCLDVAPQFPPYPLPSQVRHHLFLAAREALTNILKHSGATQARIRMFCEHSTFIFTAADNGAGFDPESASTPDAGNGLRNMQQRLEVISGSCTIVSIPRRGTTVTLKLPLRDVNGPTRK